MSWRKEPTRVKLELMSNEIEELIDVLERTPHNLYQYCGYGKIIRKLKLTQKTGESK